LFLPYVQNPANLHAVQVSTAVDPKQLTVAVRNAIREVNPRLPVKNVITLRQVLDDSLLRERLVAKLSGFFGLLALLLAAIGLYAVLSQMVLRRTKEIGIRMAVGAEQSAVLWQIMRQALGLVVAGICLAVPIALAAGRLIANQLYGLPPHDPMTFAVAVAVLLGVSTVAAYLPARRAARLDPMIALREE
jgi:ABC-type antimicrobial peptide transport system permease subunit